MSKEKFAFDKTNFILLAVAMAVVIIGFILMTGPVSTPTHFEPDIFSARRIKVAPVVCLVGFLLMIYAVLRKPRDKQMNNEGIKRIKKLCAEGHVSPIIIHKL